MAVTYRFPRPSDADAMAQLHVASWQTAYRGLMPDDALDAIDPAARADVFTNDLDSQQLIDRGVTWVVAEEDGVLLGHGMSQFHPDHTDKPGVLHMLYLHPDAIGRGVGHALHDMVLRGLHRLGARSATLKVLLGNDPAIGFYERHGWTLTGEQSQDTWSGIEVTDLEMRIDLDPDLLTENRDYWDGKAPEYADRQTWNPKIDWGMFGLPDADLQIFPDVEGLDVVELGCGTAYVSKWALDRGARTVVGLDNSPAQLATAQKRASDNGVDLPLLMGDAHHTPFADNSFDVAINEYGAAIWCDPRIWIPEAARILRPGGLIWFLGNSVQAILCAPEFESEEPQPVMLRPQKDMHRFEWIDTNNIEFHVSHGEMISILTGAGFVIEALHELYTPPEATTAYQVITG